MAGQSAGKGRGDENFPVASRLIAARLRPSILAFYDFARTADDVADDPALTADAKLARLETMRQALQGDAGAGADAPAAHALGQDLQARRLAPDTALDLLAAFRQDVVKTRYADWDDLMAYCRLSAAPVGRFLLDLHGESDASRLASDALCAALQVINHLQDCAADYRALDRIYLPADWMAAEGAQPAGLAHEQCSWALRRVLDRVIAATANLLEQAAYLPAQIHNRGLRLECRVILALAERLLDRLRHEDPLARRVRLSRMDVAWALGRALRPSDPLARQVRGAKSSFYWAMRLLPAPRRRAVYAVYGFCRAVDDIVDCKGDPAAKRAALARWEDEIEHLGERPPHHPLAIALAGAVAKFGLKRSDLRAVVAGCAMDIGGDIGDGMVRPPQAELDLYCDRVASAVGRLCLPIFGAEGAAADQVARHLGLALQRTNILRDLKEDAQLGRLYLPDEVLSAHGIHDRNPVLVLTHPALPAVRRELAAVARADYRAAERAMAACPVHAMRPAAVMMAVYENVLDRIETNRRPRAPKPVKLWLALRAALFYGWSR